MKSFLEGKFPDVADGRIADFIKTAARARRNYVRMIVVSARGNRYVAEWSSKKIQETV